MTTNANSRTRNITISLSTLAIVALILGGYYFIYVGQNEDMLHDRNFRVLSQINKNILAKDVTFKKVAANLPGDLLRFKEKVKDYYNKQAELRNEADLAKYLRLYRDSIESFARDSLEQDFMVLKSSVDSQEYVNRYLLAWARDHKASLPAPPSPRPALRSADQIEAFNGFFQVPNVRGEGSRVPFHQVEKALSDELKMSTKIHTVDPAETSQDENASRLVKDKKDDSYYLFYPPTPLKSKNGGPQYEIHLKKNLAEFMEDLMREDVYDDLLLFSVGEKVDDNKREAGVVFQTSDIPMQVKSLPDTLLLTDKEFGLLANNLRTLKIVGKRYNCYLQPMQIDEQAFILCGLVQVERFNGEKFRISTILILLLVLILFIGLLVLPVLRLRLLSYYERLGTTDVVLAMVTAILGAAALVLLLFDIYRFGGPDATERKEQLVDLSHDISHSFISELELIYDQLEKYDTMAYVIEDDQREVASMDLQTNRPLHPEIFPQYYPFFANVFWVTMEDKLGKELTVRRSLTEKVDVSGRKYLEKLKRGEAWKLPSGRAFMLESILTRTTGENLAAVSKLSAKEDASIVFLATKLYSVVETVLPYSFGFCIMDEKGDVWFHSDPGKNLQENFLEECTAKPLSSAIYARSSLFVDGNYQGKPYNIFMEPIEGLPLYIATFQEKDFFENTHEQIITFTFILIVISFLFGLAIVAQMIAFSPRRRRLRGENFLFSWLRPRTGNATAYRVLFLANLVTLIVLYLFSMEERALSVINMFGLAYIYTFMMIYFSLRRNPSPTEKQVGLPNQARFFTSAVVLLLALNLVTASLAPEDFLKTLFFQLSHIAIGAGAMMMIYRLSPVDPEDSETYQEMLWKPFKWVLAVLTPRRSYRLFLLSWLGILSIFPSIKYYSIAYSREIKLEIKHTQVQLAKDIERRDQWIDQLYRGLNVPAKAIDALKRQAIYSPPYHGTIHNGNNESEVWIEPFTVTGQLTRTNGYYSLYDSLFSRIRPRYDEKVRTTNQLRLAANADTTWYWTEGEGIMNNKHGRVKTLTYQNGVNGTLLTTHLHEYELPDWEKTDGTLFWLVFIGLLAFIYFLIDFTVRRMFAESVVEMKAPNDDEVRESINQTGQNVFMIIPPRAMGSKYKQTLGRRMRVSFKDFHDEASFWEFVEKTEIKMGLRVPGDGPRAKTPERLDLPIVLNHFEYKLSDLTLCRFKLKVINMAMDHWKQVFIVSSVDPFELLRVYQAKIREATGDDKLHLEDELESWTRTLSRFYKLNFPFESDPLPHGNASHEALIAEECRHGAFLRYLYPELLSLYKGKKAIDPEDIILDIELRAQFYYQILWTACTFEEQYILFDLAQDGLVNGRNIQAIKTLIRKGLIVNDGEELRVMNRSFRNFILASTKSEHTLEMEERVNLESTWRRVRTPIMIILFTLAGFLFITQEELVSNTTAFITAAAAGLPAIYRAIELVTGFNLGRLLSRGKKKMEEN